MSGVILPDESVAYLALAKAFPDRAQAYRAVMDRWAWLSGRMERKGRCALCARDETAAHRVFREQNATSAEGESVSIILCAACVVVLRELLDAPEDGIVLADLKRATTDEALVERIATMAHATGERPRRGSIPCDLCYTDDEPRLHWDGHDVCVGCLRDGARPMLVERNGPTTSAESRLLKRL